MKAVALMAMLLASAPAWASLDPSTSGVPVRVWISDSFGVSDDDIVAARAEADAIFREAGIEPVWFYCGLVDGTWQDSSDRCRSGVEPDGIFVRLVRSSGFGESNRVPLGEAQ